MRRILFPVVVLLALTAFAPQPQAQATTIRWALAPFGLYPNSAGRNVFTSKLYVYAPFDTQVAASNVGTSTAAGVTKRQWCLVTLKTWPKEAESDSQIIFLPDLRFGQALNDQAQLIAAALDKTDIAVPVSPSDTFRQLLVRIARQQLEQSTDWTPDQYIVF